MGGKEEAELHNIHIIHENGKLNFGHTHYVCHPSKLTQTTESPAENDKDTDCAPYVNDVDTVCGHIQLEQEMHQHSSTGREQAYEITQTLKKQNNSHIQFPYRQEQAVNEFYNDPIFCKAFPWLFPGGIGDITQKSEESLDISKWMRKLMLYEDGRFAEDKMFCFFVLNYYQRHQNNVQGAFYVTHFHKNGPENIEDLKEEIQKGNTLWIDKLLYFGSKVTGSPSYWRERRQEVYSWINYHLSEGNGPPTFFITLSCAEYHWPDIARLLNERLSLIEKKKQQHSKEYRHLLNDFTVVVQQYFQKKFRYGLKLSVHRYMVLTTIGYDLSLLRVAAKFMLIC
jgi:hypothetical protein